MCLQGGVSTGFHHVSDPPPLDIKKLYRVKLSRIAGGRSHLVVREVAALAESLVEGDVYVLDKGEHILQLNTKASAGQEKFKAAEFAQSLISERQSQCDITVFGKIWIKDQICMHGLMDLLFIVRYRRRHFRGIQIL